MSTDSQPRKRRGTPRDTSVARAARWTPDARAAAAIRELVEKAPPLTDEQRELLRAVLARPTAQGGR